MSGETWSVKRFRVEPLSDGRFRVRQWDGLTWRMIGDYCNRDAAFRSISP